MTNEIMGMLANANDGIVITDVKGSIICHNAVFTVMNHCKDAELCGAKFMSVYEPDLQKRFEQEIFPEIFRCGRWRGRIIGNSQAQKPIAQYPTSR